MNQLVSEPVAKQEFRNVNINGAVGQLCAFQKVQKIALSCLSQNGRYPRDTPREKAISMGKLKINPYFFLACNILRQPLLWLKYGFWMGKIPCQTCFRGKDPWVPCRVSLKPIYWPPLHTPKKSSAVQYSSVFINIHQYGSVSKPCTPVVHIKIAGKWMFIPLTNGINRYWSVPMYENPKVPETQVVGCCWTPNFGWILVFCGCFLAPLRVSRRWSQSLRVLFQPPPSRHSSCRWTCATPRVEVGRYI